MQLAQAFLTELTTLFPQNQFFTEKSDCWVYGYDNSRKHALPDAVIFAQTKQDIVTAIQLCFKYGVPLTARGRASNTTGATIPIQGGVILSLERMQQILKVDPINRVMVVEPGVLNSAVQAKAKE